jgi:hypothetical protein
MAVGVAGHVQHLPAADHVTGREQRRVARVVDERRQLLLVPAHQGGLVLRHAVLQQVEPGALGRLARPRPYAVFVVELALEDGRSGQARDDRRRADVIGMEVGDDDAVRHPRLREDRRPVLLRPGQPEARVDQRRAAVVGRHEIRVDVVDAERQREGDTRDAVVERHHSGRGLLSPS